jgi:hypothetical protein
LRENVAVFHSRFFYTLIHFMLSFISQHELNIKL